MEHELFVSHYSILDYVGITSLLDIASYETKHTGCLVQWFVHDLVHARKHNAGPNTTRGYQIKASVAAPLSRVRMPSDSTPVRPEA